MGRVRNWMDRMSGRRRDAPHREVPRARRRLTFERCEPRLTLSAASPAAIDEAPTNTTILFDVVGLQQLTLQTFDAASIDWQQAVPRSQMTPFVLRDGLRASLNAQGGGIVDLQSLSLNMTAGEAVATDGTPTLSLLEATQSVIQAAFDGSHLDSPNGPATFNSNSQFATLETSFGNFSFQPNLLPDWNALIPRDSHDGLSSQEPTNLYGDGGDLESEMIRIDAPQQKQDSEGGTIELTAMLGPQPTLSATAPLRLAGTRGLEGNFTATSSPATSQRPFAASEGLRARAVVVNVALVREATAVDDSAALSPRARGELNVGPAPVEAAEHARSRAARNPIERAAQIPGVDAPAAAQRTAEATADEAGPAAVQAAQPADGETASAERRAAHDAALGDWAAPVAERDDEVGVSVAVSHDRRFLGAAVALVVAGPVVRRARRGRGVLPADVEDAAGLR